MYEEVSNNENTLFNKLFDIIKDNEGKIYFRICLKIIYYYFWELYKSYKLNIDPKIIIKAQNLNIDDEMKNQILKILLIGLRYSITDEYQTLKSLYVKKDKGKQILS